MNEEKSWLWPLTFGRIICEIVLRNELYFSTNLNNNLVVLCRTQSFGQTSNLNPSKLSVLQELGSTKAKIRSFEPPTQILYVKPMHIKIFPNLLVLLIPKKQTSNLGPLRGKVNKKITQ